MRTLLAGLGLFLLSLGVADAAPPGYQITDDKFEPRITVVSPAAQAGPGEVFMLRSYVDKQTKAVTHQLYAEIDYQAPDWRFYNAAYDDRTHEHEFIAIEQKVGECLAPSLLTPGGCEHIETFGASLSDADMLDFAKSGVSFKFVSKSGFSEVIDFKEGFFAGQLSVLNAYVATPYAIDPASVPPTDPGLDLYSMGHINNKLYFGVDHGLNVFSVAKGSPADLAGIRGGDIVIDIGGVFLDKMPDYAAALVKLHGGETVAVTIKQKGQVKVVNLAL